MFHRHRKSHGVDGHQPPDKYLMSSLPQLLPLATIGVLTACWYASSSRNAVASQRLVQEYKSAVAGAGAGAGAVDDPSPFDITYRDPGAVDDPSLPLFDITYRDPEDVPPSLSSVMLILTALQLLVGFGIGWPLHHFLSTGEGGAPAEAWQWTASKRNVILGTFHFVGGLCTNMGFALGSASVVQVVKLLEPIETLLLTALANVLVLKVPHGVTAARALAVLIIVAGTSLILLQKGGGGSVNAGSVVFALCSGLAMASRNVVMKTLSPKASPGAAPADRGWRHAARQGLANYLSITAAAAVPATLGLAWVEATAPSSRGASGLAGLACARLLRSAAGREAVAYHGLYNLASISVLSLLSAPTHSLLNVGKRIVNVVYAGVAFGEPLGVGGGVGLVVAAVGGALYSAGAPRRRPKAPTGARTANAPSHAATAADSMTDSLTAA